ncbi:MAG: hypothetical protein HC836_23075 [Richelia sp. RM2_1_2]|nr:hypothetical protein [Richelia sp. RM2_1_2]
MVSKLDIASINGLFPSFNGIDVDSPEYKIVYASALNWLASEYTLEDFKLYTIQYLQSIDENTDKLELVAASKFATIGKIAYIMLQGISVAAQSIDFFQNNLKIVRQLADTLYQQKIIK